MREENAGLDDLVSFDPQYHKQSYEIKVGCLTATGIGLGLYGSGIGMAMDKISPRV